MTTPDVHPAGTAVKKRGSGDGGISSDEAAGRLSRDGGNVLPARRPAPLWRRVVSHAFTDLIIVAAVAVLGYAAIRLDHRFIHPARDRVT